MNVYVFDLNGTLANIDHRLHFIKTKPKNWPAFFEACKDDAPVEWVIDLLRTVAQGKAYILVLSGRSEQVRKATEDWLIKHGVFYSELLMRPKDEFRADEILKLEMLDGWLRRQELERSNIKFIVDDRQRVVDMWRREGFNVLQCAAWEEGYTNGQ